MKLTVSGANLKDDTATLQSCGIRAGSIVVLSGEKANKEEVEQQTASGNPEEYGLLVRIGRIVDPIKVTMESDIAQFNAVVQEKMAIGPPLAEADKRFLHDRGIYLSEKLMQALITLDGVECSPEFQTARQARRENVRLLQRLLEQVDAARAEAKKLLREE
ncbi:hypothetical protein BX666DRAFT_2016714 [Dichotomocladium elegans]|nr:hypothetical protein BX666DRAFT_2016714 [Dichotomocladium elegans]